MKQKRLLTWILAVVMIVACAALVACVAPPEPKQLSELTLPELKQNQMAVIIKNGENDYTSYTVTLTDALKTGEDVVNYLRDEAGLEVDWQESSYGKYINSIGGAKPQGAKWVTILTDIDGCQDTESAYAITYLVGDVKLISVSKGISGIPATAGGTLYFEVAG